MRQAELSTYRSLTGALGFLDAHHEVFRGINASAARRELDRLVAAIQERMTTQLARVRASRGATEGRKRLEHELRRWHMLPIAEFARARLRGTRVREEDFKALTPWVSDLKGARLVHAARAMAMAAEPHLGALVAGEFPADVLDELVAQADAVQAKFEERAGMDREVAGSTAAIKAGLRDARAMVRAIGAVVKRSARGNAELLAEWRTAQRVRRKPGPAQQAAAVE